MWSVLSDQFVLPTFCLCFPFSDINFRVTLHQVVTYPMKKTGVNQLELVNVGAKIH